MKHENQDGHFYQTAQERQVVNFSDKVLKYYLDSLTSTDDMHLSIKNSILTLYTVNCTPVELRCPSVMGLTLKTLSKQTCKQCSYQRITQACLVHRLDCYFLLAIAFQSLRLRSIKQMPLKRRASLAFCIVYQIYGVSHAPSVRWKARIL